MSRGLGAAVEEAEVLRLDGLRLSDARKASGSTMLTSGTQDLRIFKAF